MLRGLTNGLEMTVINSTKSVIPGSNYITHYQKYVQQRTGNESVFIYNNNRDARVVAVRVATQIGFQLAEHYANMALDLAEYNTIYRLKHLVGEVRAKRALASQLAADQNRLANEAIVNAHRKKILDLQAKRVQSLVDERNSVDDDLGTFECQGGKKVVAMTPYGDKVAEALFIAFDGEDQVEVKRPVLDPQTGKYKDSTFNTQTRFFCDITPSVNQTTSKEIVLTKVQGRDYTRKELVSGGDITFSVSGEINSNAEGVYPDSQVQRFIEVMQHNGVLKVSHYLFRQFNVKQIIVQDFKLDQASFKNIQPYSFSCVAVEPDEDVTVTKDTITLINDILAGSENEGWYKEMLAQKKESINSSEASDNVSVIHTATENII